MININTITNIEDLKNDVDYIVTCPSTGRSNVMCLLGDTNREDRMIVLSSKQQRPNGMHLYLVDENDDCGFTRPKLLELIESKEYSIIP